MNENKEMVSQKISILENQLSNYLQRCREAIGSSVIFNGNTRGCPQDLSGCVLQTQMQTILEFEQVYRGII
jgi:hypothetical protein